MVLCGETVMNRSNTEDFMAGYQAECNTQKVDPFLRTDREGGQWVLVDEFGEYVDIGELYTNFRGDQSHITGGTPPHKPSSTGRVQAGGCEVFPSVYGLKWARWAGHLVVSGGLEA